MDTNDLLNKVQENYEWYNERIEYLIQIIHTLLQQNREKDAEIEMLRKEINTSSVSNNTTRKRSRWNDTS